MFALRLAALSLACCAAAGAGHAQTGTSAAWEAGVRAADQAYWNAYNRADPDAMNAWLAPDVEFYHDRGGKLIGKKALAAANMAMKTAEVKLRREAVPGSVHFFPLRQGDKVYGVLVNGEHRFYAHPAGQPESLLGQAYFSNLMLLQGKQWRVARIYSYEHVGAPDPGK